MNQIMTPTYYIKHHPSFTNPSEMTAICKPLKKIGITYFDHTEVKPDGSQTGNCTNPEFLEGYLKLELYSADLHFNNIIHTQDHFLWDALIRYDKSEDLYQYAAAHDIAHMFTIKKMDGENINLYNFATTPGQDFMNTFYFQHIDLLEKFICYFHMNLAKSKRLKKAYTLPLQATKTESNFIATDKSFDVNFSASRDDFLNDINAELYTHSYNDRLMSLSARELQCAQRLLDGKTSKEIAAELNISNRTVEVYIDRLKQHFGSRNKVHLARHLVESGLINV